MRLSLVTAIILAAVCCAPVCAETISLADLIDNNGSIKVGDKLFDQFTYIANGDMPVASTVSISDFTDPFGNFGIVINGAFMDHFYTPDDTGSDATITYRVTALDPNKWISDAHIWGNPDAVGNAATNVKETFLFDEPNCSMVIQSVSPGHQYDSNVDSVVFENLHKSMWVQKDIMAHVLSEGSLASVSIIYQSFSQVPEPTCAVFLLSGLALLCCRVRRVR